MTSLNLSYSDEGPTRAEATFLLHGYPLNRTLWDEAARHLTAKGRRVVRPDLRGHGLSPVTFDASTMEACTEDVIALADQLGIDTFRLGGLSVGGYVALELVRRHPKRVTALLLADTRAEPDTPEAKAKREEAIATIRRDGMAPIA